MRAFLSHSSLDKDLVIAIHEELGREATWIDRAEIEWGDQFVERIEEGVERASDFVLFWSESSARSEWIRFELNMAFIRKMEGQAIRIRIVKLDKTELPLRLKHLHYIDVSDVSDPLEIIVKNLRNLLEEPVSGVRHRFLNRNEELDRIESAIDDPDSYLIVLRGFLGIGKTSLAQEAIRRFFSGSETVLVNVSSGTGPIELALRLSAEGGNKELPVGLTAEEARTEIQLGIERIANEGRFIVFSNVQHWLNEEARPVEPLITILDALSRIPSMRNRPALMTTTRGVRLPAHHFKGVVSVNIDGLAAQHIATLTRIWFELIQGRQLPHEDSMELAPQLHGHPIAAKLAAGLVAQYGVKHLLDYPNELISLRRDLASMLIREIKISDSSIRLLEALALLEVPVPAVVLNAGIGLGDESFQNAVADATQSGLVESRDGLALHPLLQDYYWRTHLHREDYKTGAERLGRAVWQYATNLDKTSVEFNVLLPATVRLYALAGQLDEALKLRSDLLGELAQAAITHYDRRNYELADQFLQHVLNFDPANWIMRLYRGRIMIRFQQWTFADQWLGHMLEERPYDTVLQRLIGWRYLRAREYERALPILTSVIAARPNYVTALRDAAECLHRLGRDNEALTFLEQAKENENVSPYVLDLEARILEERGQLDEAFDAAFLATVRQPRDWAYQHRLGRIRVAQGRLQDARTYFEEAMRQDPSQFTPLNSLVSVLLDMRETDELEQKLRQLRSLARTPQERSVVQNLWACYYRSHGELEKATSILEAEIRKRQNLVPNLSLLADILITRRDASLPHSPMMADTLLKQAEMAIQRCEALGDENDRLGELRSRLAERV